MGGNSLKDPLDQASTRDRVPVQTGQNLKMKPPRRFVLFALLDGEISILVAFATKIVNNIREVQSGVAIGVGERGRGRSFPLTRAVRSSGSTSWPSASSFLLRPRFGLTDARLM